jgi:hypothetical protein
MYPGVTRCIPGNPRIPQDIPGYPGALRSTQGTGVLWGTGYPRRPPAISRNARDSTRYPRVLGALRGIPGYPGYPERFRAFRFTSGYFVFPGVLRDIQGYPRAPRSPPPHSPTPSTRTQAESCLSLSLLLLLLLLLLIILSLVLLLLLGAPRDARSTLGDSGVSGTRPGCPTVLGNKPVVAISLAGFTPLSGKCSASGVRVCVCVRVCDVARLPANARIALENVFCLFFSSGRLVIGCGLPGCDWTRVPPAVIGRHPPQAPITRRVALSVSFVLPLLLRGTSGCPKHPGPWANGDSGVSGTTRDVLQFWGTSPWLRFQRLAQG